MSQTGPRRVLFFLRGIHFGRVFENFLPAMLERGHEVHVALLLEKRGLGEDKTKLFDELRRRTRTSRTSSSPAAATAGSCPPWRCDTASTTFATSSRSSRTPSLFANAHAYARRSCFARSPRSRRSDGRPVDTWCARPRRRSSARFRFRRKSREWSNGDARRRPRLAARRPRFDRDGHLRAAQPAGIPTVLPRRELGQPDEQGARCTNSPTLTLVWNDQPGRRRRSAPPGAAPTASSRSARTLTTTGSTGSRARRARSSRRGSASTPTGRSSSTSARRRSSPATRRAFVRRWLARLRAHGGVLETRRDPRAPAPRTTSAGRARRRRTRRRVVWPKQGEEPVDEASRANYFDTLFHSAAVVGINTSAQIEAPIVGRPVLTLVSDDFATPEGTLHFSYLADEATEATASSPSARAGTSTSIRSRPRSSHRPRTARDSRRSSPSSSARTASNSPGTRSRRRGRAGRDAPPSRRGRPVLRRVLVLLAPLLVIFVPSSAPAGRGARR